MTLFFGALIGTNMGAFDGVPLKTYVAIILLLAGTVMVMQLIGQARSRRYLAGLLAGYGLLIGYAWWSGLFAAVDPPALERLAATLAVWFGIIILIELTPILPGPAPANGDEPEKPGP